MKTVLVPVDYSLDSRQALTFAIDLARLSKAEIILLHAFHEPLSTGNAFKVDEAIAQLEKEKNQILEEFATEIQFDTAKNFSLKYIAKENSNPAELGNLSLTSSGNHVVINDAVAAARSAVKITGVSKFGLAAEEILAAAATYHADLIIMSMRGAGAVSQAFMGSTVTEVFQSAKVPVLALPATGLPKQIQKVVFATDLSCLPNHFNLNTLQQLVKILRADLQVLHLYQENNPQAEQTKVTKALAVLNEQLGHLDYQVSFRWADDVAAGIQKFMQEQQADLLVLIPNRHTFLERLFSKSITGKFTE